MGLLIQVDTREKKNGHILEAFDAAGVRHFSRVCRSGDYKNYNQTPHSGPYKWLVIERKASLEEAAQTLIAGKDRFDNEIQRCEAMGEQMVMLIETPLNITIETMCAYRLQMQHVYATIYELRALLMKYVAQGLIVEFVKPEHTGQRIIELFTEWEQE